MHYSKLVDQDTGPQCKTYFVSMSMDVDAGMLVEEEQ